VLGGLQWVIAFLGGVAYLPPPVGITLAGIASLIWWGKIKEL